MQSKNFTSFFHFLSDLAHAVNPFIDRFPAKEKEAYLEDVVQKLTQKFGGLHQDNKKSTIVIPYKNIVAYAQKKL